MIIVINIFDRKYNVLDIVHTAISYIPLFKTYLHGLIYIVSKFNNYIFVQMYCL